VVAATRTVSADARQVLDELRARIDTMQATEREAIPELLTQDYRR
jgi:hypothetical protein